MKRILILVTIVIAAAILALAGVYGAALASSALGRSKPAGLIQLHDVCSAVFAESHIDDRCPRPLLRPTVVEATPPQACR